MADAKSDKVALVNEDSISINNIVEIADLNNPISIALDPSQNMVFVANFVDNRILRICISKAAFFSAFESSNNNSSPNNLGNSNSRDCQQQNQGDFGTIPLPDGSKPLSIAFDSKHKELYATNVNGNTVLITNINEAMVAMEREEVNSFLW
jgi:DNA-binding beta-propeller fold protein YncE